MLATTTGFSQGSPTNEVNSRPLWQNWRWCAPLTPFINKAFVPVPTEAKTSSTDFDKDEGFPNKIVEFGIVWPWFWHVYQTAKLVVESLSGHAPVRICHSARPFNDGAEIFDLTIMSDDEERYDVSLLSYSN